MPAATAKSTMTHRALPWLLLVAACGLTHHHLHLLLGAEAQQLQPAELPPATGAMRFLEGSWQGVVRDSGTKIRCAESVVQRDGILNQVPMTLQWYGSTGAKRHEKKAPCCVYLRV